MRRAVAPQGRRLLRVLFVRLGAVPAEAIARRPRSIRLANQHPTQSRLVDADNAAHGPDWATRKLQAAALLDQAKKTLLPSEQLQLEKQAGDLLTPAVK
jgi:hypothetical protein